MHINHHNHHTRMCDDCGRNKKVKVDVKTLEQNRESYRDLNKRVNLNSFFFRKTDMS